MRATRTVKEWERSKSFKISNLIERTGQTLSGLAMSKFQEVARLAFEHFADCLKCREADRVWPDNSNEEDGSE